MKISGFTFAHNFIECGMPTIEAISAVRPYVDEIVAVDIESTDGSERVLSKLCEKVVKSPWAGRDTTPDAFLKNIDCKGDIILFFEADEVYSDDLLEQIYFLVGLGKRNIAVHRIQVEQNFQRVREYPIPVHRVFPRGGGTYRIHPTIWPESMRLEMTIVPPEKGLLWDCSNCFRDNWLIRKQTQSEIWGEPRHLIVGNHFTQPNEVTMEEELKRLQGDHWMWKDTPLKIPNILKPLVGKTKYEVNI